MAHPYHEKRESERHLGKERFKRHGGDVSCMPKRAHGGRVMHKGGDNGVGRIEKAKAYGLTPIKSAE
jgi:hypothetical protein